MGEVQRGKREVKVIPLTQGQVVFVSDHRFQELNQFKWHAQWRGTLRSGSFYAARNSGRKCISMHDQILGMEGGRYRCCDHRFGGTLNNCDYNLRPASRSQNSVNRRKQAGTSSRYMGVSYNRRDKKWQAAITVNKQRISLGYFDDEEKAAWARDTAALKYFGEFARLNFSSGGDTAIDYDDAREVELYLASKSDGPNGARDGTSKGEENGQAKLTWTQVCLIRLLGLVGMAQHTIGKRFGVSQTTVWRILRCIMWRETPEMEQLFAAYWLALVAHT